MKTLAKKDLSKVLVRWSGKYEVIAPVKTAQGDCVFDVFNEKTFTLDYKKPPLPPKSVFSPQTETIFNVQNYEYKETVPAKQRLLFGIRSCDMMGLLQATSFMIRDQKDMYYSARKNAAVTVVMACPGAQNENCFCTTTRSGPIASRGFDLQCFDMGDVYLVQAGTSLGQELLSDAPVTPIDDKRAKKQMEEFRQKAVDSMPQEKAVIEAMTKLMNKQVNEKIWDNFGDKCITCGGCAFVCPTCTCFNVYDQQSSPGNGLRIRAWDACLYSGFTREASGHNPRSSQALRLKRRHEHKLLDYSVKDVQDGLCGCVGCGRCSDFCPVHIGTLEVVKAIAG
jgi:ferredoxin